MNAIQRLCEHVSHTFPTATALIDRPLHVDGIWFLDVRLNGRTLVVQWRPPNKFGISLLGPETGFGEGPDEAFETIEATQQRIDQILQ